MKSTRTKMFLAIAFSGLLAGWSPGRGQELSAPSMEDIQERVRTLKDERPESTDTGIEEYQQALAALGRAADARAMTQKFAADAAEAPALGSALSEELARAPVEPELVPDESLPLRDLESRLEQAEADLAASRALLDELTAIGERRAKRKSEIPEEIATAQQELSNVEEALIGLPPGAENEARRVLLLAQVEEFRTTIEALEAERAVYDARREVLPLRRDRALRRVTQAENVAAFWRDLSDTRRAADGESAAKSARKQIEDVTRRFPALGPLAAETRELVALRSGESGLPTRIREAQAELELTRRQREEVRSRFGAARRRINAGGLTEGMGLILRRDYEWLPQASALKADSARRERALSEAQLELIATGDERDAVGDIVTATDRLLASLGLESPSDELEAAARGLLTTQRESHDAVLGELETLSTAFYEHKSLGETLLTESLAYRDFIEKRILWVRSSSSNPWNSVLAAPVHTTEMLRTLGSEVSAREATEFAAGHWARFGLMGLLWMGLVATRRMSKRDRREMGEKVRSYRTDKYLYTMRALAQSVLLALPIPLVAWTVGWLLSDAPGELARAAGGALCEIAVVWWTLRFLRELAADKGVGAAHFRWPASSVAVLRRELRWFEPFAVGLGFVALALDRHANTDWSDSVGRLCFVGAMGALAIFAHRLLRAESHLWANSPSARKGLLGKTHGVWSLVASGLPVALALLAIAGYYYTALQFELRLRYSIGFAISLVTVNSLLLRWLFMTRRRLAVRQALDAKARREHEEEAELATESSTPALDADKVDIPAIDAQTRQLFKASITLATAVGLFFIWASVLPALRGLDRIQLLPELAVVSSEADLETLDLRPAPAVSAQASPSMPGVPNANATPPEGEEANGLGLPARLTLADALLAILLALLTSVAAKNLPALLELAVLQRLPLDGGARYAAATIIRYIILIAGVSAVSGALGIGWQQVQWLAAALTFGLAFGLQEIFANFVSGLIILIERPIRVGDIVTVGATEGRVTQLRMRATTILDWDRREYLVPNKEFITSSVINWTLSDPVTRMVVPVGIAYGSDTARARRLLLEAASSNPLVLDDPAPSAVFRSFGGSSLDFELRMFIANRDLWPQLIDRIHSQIDEAFRAAGIEIAFPQRDLHIRSADGLRDKAFAAEDPPPTAIS